MNICSLPFARPSRLAEEAVPVYTWRLRPVDVSSQGLVGLGKRVGCGARRAWGCGLV